MSSQPPPASNSGSSNQNLNPHAPLTPSGLRVAQTLSVSPDDQRQGPVESSSSECSPRTAAAHGRDGEIEPMPSTGGSTSGGTERGGSDKIRAKEGPEHEGQSLLGQLEAGDEALMRETTPLLNKPIEFITEHIHPGPCNHGTFSPQPCSRAASVRSLDRNKNGEYSGTPRGILGSIANELAASVGKKMSTTARIAEEHGIDTSRTMYVPRPITLKGQTNGMSSNAILTERINQVLYILHPILRLDQTVQNGLSEGRPCSSDNDGFFVHPHGTLLRCESRPCSSNQRPLFFRL
jgi:hypothetical protein